MYTKPRRKLASQLICIYALTTPSNHELATSSPDFIRIPLSPFTTINLNVTNYLTLNFHLHIKCGMILYHFSVVRAALLSILLHIYELIS